ncbi:helix-turn-helix domain-containing protein [Limnohabitans sp.]|uniref:helix-turn-helix domain-containing protein n=1 Tax=Limnohabitans sp. TaxID=1907725 RepID=UPI00286EC788|nr:helix-turn-helix domain-containing protein [Limnohabitans sp.]
MSGKAYIQKSILASLLDEGTATRPQLAELIGCGTANVYTAMRELLKKGFVQRAPYTLDPKSASGLPIFGLTKAGIDVALVIDPSEVEHA